MHNATEALQLLRKAAKARQSAETAANPRSSRSHAVFTVGGAVVPRGVVCQGGWCCVACCGLLCQGKWCCVACCVCIGMSCFACGVHGGWCCVACCVWRCYVGPQGGMEIVRPCCECTARREQGVNPMSSGCAAATKGTGWCGSCRPSPQSTQTHRGHRRNTGGNRIMQTPDSALAKNHHR